ncbi:MAG: ATP-binding protein, partial [Chloroflexota bacterium]
AIDPEFRLSPYWIIGMLLGLGMLFTTMDALIVPSAGSFSFVEMAVMCYALAAVIWGLERWHSSIGRWFIIIAPLLLVNLSLLRLEMPDLTPLLILLPLLALALITWTAAIITALLETIGLLFLWPTITAMDSDSLSIILTIGLIWTVIGLLWAIIRPHVQRTQWSYEQFQQMQHLLDETRQSKGQLAQMQQELKSAYRTQTLLNDRLAALKLIAEEAQQTKAACVAKISHEFRTPLNMILGLIDTLVEAPETYTEGSEHHEIPPLLLQSLEIVQRNTDHLATMIDDVLDLSQAEAGQLALHREWVDLAPEIEKAVAAVVLPLIEKKGLYLQLSIADDFPQVYCDKTRIRQVILNLVSNAARFTERGGITVEAHRQGHQVLISVADTGSGISSVDLERIFEPFYQSDSVQSGLGGSGLGLNISQQFIERHQGRLWVESEGGLKSGGPESDGCGSTFTFSLPISPPAPTLTQTAPRLQEDWFWHERATPPKLPQISRKNRIMICDESGDLAPLLARYSDEIAWAYTRTLPKAIEALQLRPVHTLILNATTPGRLISMVEQARQALPEMPLIGCAFPPKIEYSLEAGAHDYLVKPVRQADLAEALRRFERPVKHVLIVDDDPNLLQLFCQMLLIVDETIVITTAVNGAEALAELRRFAQHGRLPDLLLLDILMPDMTGWQVLEEKNQDEAICDVPVIVVSGETLVEMPTHSPILLATMGAGLTVNKLLQCARELSALLLKPDGELESEMNGKW